MLSSLIASLHAELLRSGHTNGAEVGEDMFPLIFAVFGVFVAHWEDWAELVQYLQQANKPEYQEGCAILCAPRQIYGSCRMLTPKPELLNDLREAGAILEIGVSYSRCRLSFINERVLSWLCDYGAWLELYLYAKIRQSGLTDDVMLDAVLSWDDDADDDDTVNEVDVLALRGDRLYLFSCKAGAVNTADLNELAVLAHRFGEGGSILATAATRTSLSHAFVMRAESMGVTLLTREDLMEPCIDECLKCIFGESKAV